MSEFFVCGIISLGFGILTKIIKKSLEADLNRYENCVNLGETDQHCDERKFGYATGKLVSDKPVEFFSSYGIKYDLLRVVCKELNNLTSVIKQCKDLELHTTTEKKINISNAFRGLLPNNFYDEKSKSVLNFNYYPIRATSKLVRVFGTTNLIFCTIYGDFVKIDSKMTVILTSDSKIVKGTHDNYLCNKKANISVIKLLNNIFLSVSAGLFIVPPIINLLKE